MTQRPKHITVRVGDEERGTVRERARASGLSISEFVRRRVLGKLIMPRNVLVTLGELTRILNELRRLGGLLKNIHLETRGQYSEDTRKAINALERYGQELRDHLKELSRSVEESINKVNERGTDE